MITFLSIYVYIYPPVKSNMAMYRPSCALTAAFLDTDSVAIVGKSASSFLIILRWFILFAHTRNFMYTLWFYFRKNGDATVSDN